MSLIALTEHLRAGRSMARTLLLLIALTGAVIIGLLAMHSLNTHATAESGHHATMATDQAGASVMGDAHAATTVSAEESCADCGTSHSGMLAMACVLALLATALLLACARGAQQWLALLPRPGPRALPAPDSRGLHPPSLTVLCISRT
ncbi:DUF6153 family protein [Microbacterium sp. Leaf151]|uniref:DUF6153 family protein n=1 Tax=Microbacterium sp. Leaf151 TaxID=1736276 RepID=UPI0006F52B63|nr:DUF6153 family protein [Microbacterium sp. Leaf151]KQR26121.1 hypothetical protein ASF76_02340 [Microbacterium sp. Leaf151]